MDLLAMGGGEAGVGSVATVRRRAALEAGAEAGRLAFFILLDQQQPHPRINPILEAQGLLRAPCRDRETSRDDGRLRRGGHNH